MRYISCGWKKQPRQGRENDGVVLSFAPAGALAVTQAVLSAPSKAKQNHLRVDSPMIAH
jgi:hypothetical protein